MKVSELIEYLSLRDPDLEVYGFCDHGQTPEKVQYPGVIWAASPDTVWEEYVASLEEAKECGFTYKAILL